MLLRVADSKDERIVLGFLRFFIVDGDCLGRLVLYLKMRCLRVIKICRGKTYYIDMISSPLLDDV